MRDFLGILGKLRVLFSRRALLFVIRAVAILSMSFAAAFGFLAAMNSPGAHYDPHSFAIGAAALFGAACLVASVYVPGNAIKFAFLCGAAAGIFAAGDVRSGSIKRCSAAIGEGSMAVALVHRRLAELPVPTPA